MSKDTIIKARISDKQVVKLNKILENTGMTISQWIRQKIDKSRYKK